MVYEEKSALHLLNMELIFSNQKKKKKNEKKKNKIKNKQYCKVKFRKNKDED